MVLVRQYLATQASNDALGLRVRQDNTISKCEGAAKYAGLMDNDHIVSVGDVKVTNDHHCSAMELLKNWSKVGRIAIEVRRDEPSGDKQEGHGKKRKAASVPANANKQRKVVQADDDKAKKQARSKAPAKKQQDAASKQPSKVEPAKTGKKEAKAGESTTAPKLPVGKPGCQRCAHLESEVTELRKRLAAFKAGTACLCCGSSNTKYTRARMDNDERDSEGTFLTMGSVRCLDCKRTSQACWSCRAQECVSADNSGGGGIMYRCGKCGDDQFDDWDRRDQEGGGSSDYDSDDYPSYYNSHGQRL